MSSQNFGMKSYMKGALLLTVAAIIVKVLSAAYRVPFQNLVGDQGFYVYQQVYPFIAFFVVWTSTGFAVAISKMLADFESSGVQSEAEKRAVSTIIFRYLTALSLIFFCVLFFGADLLAGFMWDAQLAPLLRTGAFVTLCMPMLALLKGTYQAKAMMEPVAYAQVFEQMIRVSIILVGTVIVMATSQSVYAAGTMAMLGTVLGEVAGVILLVFYMRKKLGSKNLPKIHVPAWPIIKEVTFFSVSISMSGLLLLCFQLVDSFSVFSMLIQSGMAEVEAMELKGIYDRGQPLVQLGIVIASSLSLAIVPLVAFKSKNNNGRGAIPFIQLTYRTAILFAVAAALGLILVMPYVNVMLFKTDALSGVLMLYVVQIIPLSIILTFTAILQGYSKLKVPAGILLIGILLKILGNLLLIQLFEMFGAALASNIGLIVAAVALIWYLKRLMSVQLASRRFYVQLVIASVAMIFTVKLVAVLLTNILGDVENSRISAVWYSGILIFAGAFVFITIVAKLRLLAVKEWFLIPLGRRMATYQLWLNRKK
ncbi:putative polysaccharide biosynthesis protein [Solibacillus sp. FSL H8-0538]|uniref:putative polysaccharide biosynthesis protein n=1 Tax=Solibacillus sp. FSL H8-0538 TaxID=2921400 RepID=UPI0030F7326A